MEKKILAVQNYKRMSLLCSGAQALASSLQTRTAVSVMGDISLACRAKEELNSKRTGEIDLN